MRNLYAEIRRVRWMLAIAVLVLVARTYQWLPDTSALAMMLHKAALAASGLILAHIGYQQAFPYLDQHTLLREGQRADGELRVSLLFLGTCLLRGAIYAAFILAFSLGL